MFLGGKFAFDKQVADFVEGRVLCEVFNRVATVTQNPLIAVNEGDGRLRGACADITWVVGDQTCLGQHFPQRNAVVALGCADDVHLELAARVVEHSLIVLSSHSFPFTLLSLNQP